MMIHRDESHRRDVVAAWARRGLERGEQVLYAGVPEDCWLALSLSSSGVDVPEATAQGRLRVLLPEEFYLDEQPREAIDGALAAGFPGVRVSAEARAALLCLSEPDYQAFERLLEQWCESLPVSGLCVYESRWVEGARLTAALCTHGGGVSDESMWLCRRDDRILLAGEVDFTSAALLAKGLRHATEAADQQVLTVDLSRLGFMDVEGYRSLLVGTRAFRGAGGIVFLESAQPPVEMLLSLLAVERQPNVFVV